MIFVTSQFLTSDGAEFFINQDPHKVKICAKVGPRRFESRLLRIEDVEDFLPEFRHSTGLLDMPFNQESLDILRAKMPNPDAKQRLEYHKA